MNSGFGGYGGSGWYHTAKGSMVTVPGAMYGQLAPYGYPYGYSYGKASAKKVSIEKAVHPLTGKKETYRKAAGKGGYVYLQWMPSGDISIVKWPSGGEPPQTFLAAEEGGSVWSAITAELEQMYGPAKTKGQKITTGLAQGIAAIAGGVKAVAGGSGGGGEVAIETRGQRAGRKMKEAGEQGVEWWKSYVPYFLGATVIGGIVIISLLAMSGGGGGGGKRRRRYEE